MQTRAATSDMALTCAMLGLRTRSLLPAMPAHPTTTPVASVAPPRTHLHTLIDTHAMIHTLSLSDLHLR